MKIGNVNLQLYKTPNSYNAAATNERTIEIPLGFYFKDYFKNDIIEIGAVTPYYHNCQHEVYDLYDSYKKCIRKDFSTCDDFYKNKNILSISTVEHIGFDNYSNQHGKYPVERWDGGFIILQKIISSCNNYLLTIPIGYNPVLDHKILQSDISHLICKRTNRQNDWEQDLENNINYAYGRNNHIALLQKFGYTYNKAIFNNANAICIITNLKDFFN